VRDRDPRSEFYHNHCRLVRRVLAAKRRYVSELSEDARRAVERGWRRNIDRTVLLACLNALEWRRRSDLAEVVEFARDEASVMATLATRVVQHAPLWAARLILRTLRQGSRLMRRNRVA
jgi:hypothetical protein